PPQSTLFPYTTLFRSVIIFTLPIKNKHTVFNTEKTIKLKVSKSLFLSSIIEEKIAEYTENCNLKKVKINKETCSLHYIVKVKTRDRKSTRLNSSHVSI